MSIGSDTPIDQLLAEYLPQSESLIGETFEDETNQLLYAVLLELRGESGINREKYENTYPTYRAFTVDFPAVSGQGEWQTVSWDFDASEVIVYGIEEEISVAFSPRNENTDRAIRLGTKHLPFSVPMSEASKAWLRRENGDGAEASAEVIAIA